MAAVSATVALCQTLKGQEEVSRTQSFPPFSSSSSPRGPSASTSSSLAPSSLLSLVEEITEKALGEVEWTFDPPDAPAENREIARNASMCVVLGVVPPSAGAKEGESYTMRAVRRCSSDQLESGCPSAKTNTSAVREEGSGSARDRGALRARMPAEETPAGATCTRGGQEKAESQRESDRPEAQMLFSSSGEERGKKKLRHSEKATGEKGGKRWRELKVDAEGVGSEGSLESFLLSVAREAVRSTVEKNREGIKPNFLECLSPSSPPPPLWLSSVWGPSAVEREALGEVLLFFGEYGEEAREFVRRAPYTRGGVYTSLFLAQATKVDFYGKARDMIMPNPSLGADNAGELEIHEEPMCVEKFDQVDWLIENRLQITEDAAYDLDAPFYQEYMKDWAFLHLPDGQYFGEPFKVLGQDETGEIPDPPLVSQQRETAKSSSGRSLERMLKRRLHDSAESGLPTRERRMEESLRVQGDRDLPRSLCTHREGGSRWAVNASIFP